MTEFYPSRINFEDEWKTVLDSSGTKLFSKKELVAFQITSPFNKKIDCFVRRSVLFLFYETTKLIVEWGSYLASQ